MKAFLNDMVSNNQDTIINIGIWLLSRFLIIVKLCFAGSRIAGRFGICLYLVSWLLVIPPAFADYPRRIISGMPSITEMLFALELDDRIVGVTNNCNYPPQALKKEKVGGFFLNLEKIVSLKPDLIVMLESAQARDIRKFREFGLPVHSVNPMTVIEVMGTMVELGEMTGAAETAEAVVEEMKRRILTVEAKVRNLAPRKVLVMVGYKPLIVVGGGNFIDDVIRYAGAENVAAQARAAYPQYSFEKLLEDNPDYIIIPEGMVGKDEIEADRRWQSLEAVRRGRLLFMDADILSRPGPRIVEAIEKIAAFIHEEKN
jgi:iron complex transport system substrate-binding protein